MTTATRTQTAPTPVRLPNELKEALKEAAETNDRSLNREIVNRLRSTFKGRRTQHPTASKGQP